MFWDFYEYRGIVDSVQDEAWEALEVQEAIENWAEGLEGLVRILDFLADALDTLAAFYPPFTFQGRGEGSTWANRYTGRNSNSAKGSGIRPGGRLYKYAWEQSRIAFSGCLRRYTLKY